MRKREIYRRTRKKERKRSIKREREPLDCLAVVVLAF